MTYNEHTGEKIVYEAHISWWNFTGPVFLLLVWLSMPSGNSIKAFVGILAFAGIIYKLIQHFTTELYIGEKFVVAKYGLIRRETIEILHSKVESIRVNQGILGRILGYGNVVIIGAGGSKNSIHFISKPVAFRNAWMNLHSN